ncbi:MAG: hypothetical protein SWY16_12135 [Cyanobacteriota bacterium]|nr:hypothetical protein [Cyanobacteriota bacterium]
MTTDNSDRFRSAAETSEKNSVCWCYFYRSNREFDLERSELSIVNIVNDRPSAWPIA